jgi:5-methylcytosine-specific restriction endonuclease McrA
MDHRIDGANLIPKRNAKHQFRQRIFDAWQHCCAYCGASADTLDHIKPRHKGGATIVSNLVPACKNCNRCKGSEHWQEWFKNQPYWMPSREDAVRRWLSSDNKIP